MQEIKKRRIVIASVLKPVDDTRMFEKIGISLAPFYEVHIIGYPGIKPPETNAIVFHALQSFRRLSPGRIMAPFRILFRALKLKPDIFIITTHELLISALVVQFISGAKIIYDVQENYRRNILHTNAFPLILRPVLASWVAVKEWFARFYVDHYLLAEEGYKRELFFPNGRATVLENKFKKPEIQFVRTRSEDGMIRLLFSGTLNEATGIFTAIHLVEKLHAVSGAIRLTIIGNASQEHVRSEIRRAIAGKNYITLIGGERLVPHKQIVNEISQSDFGIISYPSNPATINSIPTKLFEYLGSKLPMLLINHPVWVSRAQSYPAAVVFDSENLEPSKILYAMRETRFYATEADDVFWEEEKLLDVMLHLFPVT